MNRFLKSQPGWMVCTTLVYLLIWASCYLVTLTNVVDAAAAFTSSYLVVDPNGQ